MGACALLVAVLLLFLSLAEGAPLPEFDDAPRPREVQEPEWFETSFLDLRDDLAVATGAHRKRGLVVYFHQQDCAYCEALIDINFGSEDIRRYTQQKFDVVSIDIWGSREVVDPQGVVLSEREYAVREKTNFTPSGQCTSAVDWADGFGLFYAPTLVFFDARGDEVMRVDSVLRLYRLRRILRFVLEKGYLEDATYQLWRRRQQQ
jgi:thioredoxin-related protein